MITTDKPESQTQFRDFQYQIDSDIYDEMWDANIAVRPHWQPIMNSLNSFSPLELQRRDSEAQRLLRENGVTFNVHGDMRAEVRPWQLDLAPLIIAADEWDFIESGLKQRALLLRLLLEDIHGKQILIKEGLIPPELIYTIGGLIRPCFGIQLDKQNAFILYSADIARGEDQQWWVINDWTQAPVGVGYALENRIIMSRVLPDMFKECHVRRLSQFFHALRNTLEAVRIAKVTHPRIVVLSGGIHDQSHFENSYLAAYLGYPLVYGDDLTVRDGHVMMKCVDKLKQVDVILRRIEDRMSDPLELFPDSSIGVTGLVEAVRRGNVMVVNPLGSSVLENPGLMAFLPGICQKLMAQDLLLPSARTWWCGQEKECQYVLDNLERLVIKPIYRHADTKAQIGAQLDSRHIAELRHKIKSQPYMYVGQELIRFSTSPSLREGKLDPRHTILRTFLTANENDFSVMPGGLTLSASLRDHLITDYKQGGITKDCWVPWKDPEEHITMWHSSSRLNAIAEYSVILTSRVAEALFQVGRLAERIEGLARLCRCTLKYYHEIGSIGLQTDKELMRILIATLNGVIHPDISAIKKKKKSSNNDWESQLHSMIFDSEQPGSIRAMISMLIETAYTIRERWSHDTWRIIASFNDRWDRISSTQKVNANSLLRILDRLIYDLTALSGLNMESMTRELGWIFLDIGRRRERASLLIEVLNKTIVPQHQPIIENQILEAILRAMESQITYRRRYRSQMQLQPVLELLLLDETNPRSLVYQFNRLAEHIAILPKEKQHFRLSQIEQKILEAATFLRIISLPQLAVADGELGCHPELYRTLSHLAKLLDESVDLLTNQYFAHIKLPQQLVPVRAEFS